MIGWSVAFIMKTRVGGDLCLHHWLYFFLCDAKQQQATGAMEFWLFKVQELKVPGTFSGNGPLVCFATSSPALTWLVFNSLISLNWNGGKSSCRGRSTRLLVSGFVSERHTNTEVELWSVRWEGFAPRQPWLYHRQAEWVRRTESCTQTGLERQDVHVVLPLAQNGEFRSNEWDGKGHA